MTPSWPTGEDARGPYSEDPSGRRWYPHPEDDAHWDHYHYPGGRYPKEHLKPWPGQKRPPYGDQSATDPWPAPQFAPRYFGPSMDELQMEIESNARMETFWCEILAGSLIAGGGVIGGPALLPEAGGLGWLASAPVF